MKILNCFSTKSLLGFTMPILILTALAFAQFEPVNASGMTRDGAEPGDINQDGVVNLLDVRPFQDLLFNDCEFQCEADINQDGVVDLIDYCLFIDIIQAG